MFYGKTKNGIRCGAAIRVIAFVLVCAFLISDLSGFPGLLSMIVHAEEAPAQTYNIHSATEFIEYSHAYAAGSRNARDVLNISINEGSVVTDDGFISLGTSAHPFAGTINVPSAGIDVFHLFDCPLFNYVSTDLKITGAGMIKIMRERVSETPADGVLTSGALFAQHVTAGSDPAQWRVALLAYDGEGTEASSFASLIGDIAAGADVTVVFANSANIPVSAAGNAGLICGTLNAGARLAVSTSGSGDAISVTATSGNAGGLIGEMKSGSTLQFNSDNHSRVTDVTASAGYAGGIVGAADSITVAYDTGISDYAVSGRVTGQAGAGGLFGKYVNSSSPATFTMKDTYQIASGMRVSGANYVGGVFGMLENGGASFTFDGNSASETITVNLAAGKYRGGVCGGYKAAALAHTFEITDTATTISASYNASNYSGGLIGTLTSSPAYVNIHDVTCSSTGAPSAGLIGTAGAGGSFIDLTGGTVISGTFDAGLVADMPQGVLRMSGVFDLSGYTQYSIASGYLVKDRGRSLIYALGNGSGTVGNWSFKRNVSRTIDDIHTWGQVIRMDTVRLKESDLLTVDMSAHTVTVGPAVPAMTRLTDFAATALNIKLNTADAVGALRFTSGNANKSATLLAGTLSLEADISLVGTGLLGLTRDDGANNVFSGTLDGKNHTLTIATGETYGVQPNGSALDATSKQGNIFQHGYSGIFAKTAGATVKDLTVSGECKFYQTVKDVRFGGVTAYATNALTLDNIKVDFSVRTTVTGDFNGFYGGLVAISAGTGLALSIEDCDLGMSFTDISTVSGDVMVYVGGAVGVMIGEKTSSFPSSPEHTSTQNVSITSTKLGLTYNKTGSADRTSCFGSAIAGAPNCIYRKDARRITLTDVDIDLTATGRTHARKFGGIFGMDWYAVDVTVDDVRIDSSVTATGNAADFGGLVHLTTGHWNVSKITLNSADYSLPSASGSTFGFVTNKTYVNGAGEAKSALYLDVDNTDDNYDIAALSFAGNSPTFDVFDEIAADSRFNAGNIADNGNSVISVTTEDDILHTSGSGFNTYLNKTVYGKLAAAKINPQTRYYYNMAYARANTATPKYNFLVWSAKTYAHSSLAEWFPSSATFTGDLEMVGLSYYPVDLKEGVTFTNATIKLDNYVMENNVKYAYDGEAGTRTTRSATNQHYLMHTAMFRNDPGSSVTISGLTMKGNVPKLSDSFCGFLFAGTLGNSSQYNVRFTASGLVLDGVHILTSSGDYLTTNTYAPLFINKVGRNTSLKITSAEQSDRLYSSYGSGGLYAGSSLIGDVGSSTARAIYLNFSGLKFDGRSSNTSIGNMDTAYGTTRSIFSRSTILNSFLYSGESSGSYTYEITEDWAGAGSATHGVTYGKEVTTSVEFADKQKNYYGSEFYTHPTTYQATGAYDFSTGFLPHVYTAYNLSEYKHELAVNVTFSSQIEGCGKYNDPFIIDDDDKLPIISRIINGQNVGSAVELSLPSDLTSYNYTKTNYTKNTYNFGTDNFTSSNGGSSRSNSNVRKYLAGAYYVITRDIELPGDYVSLGTVDNNNNTEYAFRGLLIGRNITVTNRSRDPLIHTSHGCVVKDLTVKVDVDFNGSNEIQLAAPLGNATYNYIGGIQSYGAVIGQILGGDTIIDNIDVDFDSAAFNITAASDNNYPRLTPVGGYVGTLFGGGLIFRNMSASYTGLTADTFDKISDAGYLYVNPIIGRVVNGYAFHELESGAYNTVSETVNNGSKNYTIPDLSRTAGKLTVTNASSTYTISVPDGQAMYILGAAVNSGACSATTGSTMSGLTAYETISGMWQAYRGNTTVRGGASYSGVGTSSGDDFTDASLDLYNTGRGKIPYILRAYTTNDNSCLYMRSLTRRDNNILSITGDCDVPAGFRGIGGFYYDSDYLRLRVSSVDGKGGGSTRHTVTLHMDYRHYEKSSVTSYQCVTNTAGFGLFNTLKIKNPSETNSVHDIILSGSVFYDVYTIGGSQSKYNFGTGSNQVNVDEYCAVGGIAGLINKTAYYIKDVTFNNFSAEGAKGAGGLVGYVTLSGVSTISYIKFTSGVTNPGHVNVVGGLYAGGLIGRIYKCGTEIIGASGGTDLILRNIEVKSTSLNDTGISYVNNKTTGAGGVIGNCWPAHNDGVERDTIHGEAAKIIVKRMFISNLNVVKGTEDANVRVRNNTSNVTNFNAAGGFIGVCHYALLHMDHCQLRQVNVKANLAGGIVGMLPQKYFVRFNDVTADGVDKSSCSITGNAFAGGIFGQTQGRDEWFFDINEIKVKNYTVQAATTVNNAPTAAGGFIGDGLGDNVNTDNFSSHICEIRNSEITNCDIKTNYINGNNYCGTGGVIGVIRAGVSAANKLKFSGYNLRVDHVTLSHLNNGTADNTATTNRKIGDVIGNNAALGGVKFVGVTVISDSYCGKHAGYYNNTSENYGNGGTAFGNGYIVFADFGGSRTGTSFASIDDTSTEADDCVNVSAASPYVTVNPTLSIGPTLLTGDGVASTTDDLAIRSILADTATGRYAYAAGNRYDSFTTETNFAACRSFTGKFAMFRSEVSDYIGTDFPVLILDDTTRANSHKMINSYLRMLTNTRYDFGSDEDGVYDVKIYNMQYTDRFTPRTTGASLKRDGGQFYMLNSQFDSGKNQFSLIDVRFYDPAESDNTAYHLYVPIFVKKVLSFRFDIAELSGTTYLDSLYTSRFGQALIENVGMPVTLFFRYTYSRTAEEWADSINLGEDVHRNYEKKLLFYKANTNELLQPFPANTVLVLVDPNDNNKPYYATVGNAMSGNTLNLSAFRSGMSKSGSGYTFSGDVFAPKNLEELMSISVAADASGTLVSCAAGDATVVASGQGYRAATEEELADGSITKYTASVSDILPEQYYLSIYTESNAVNDELFHYFLITTPSSFSDTLHPSKISDTGAHTMVHLVMGKIFHHAGLVISSNSATGSPMMTAANNLLRIDMTAVFGLSDDLDSDIKADIRGLVSATEVYQSFLIYLNRQENQAIRKEILGDPVAAGSYCADYVLNGAADAATTAYSASGIRVTQNYAEFVTGNLSSYFASGDHFEIDSSVTLTYSADAIPTQFPGRTELPPSDNNGVTISGSSNIAFQQDTTTYSENTIGAAESPARSYYSETAPEVATLDLNPIGDRVGDFTPLGINALNIGDSTVADFDLLADLNIGPISERVVEYTDAVVTIQLAKKQADDTYGEPLDISRYMTIDFEGVNGITHNSDTYTQIIPRAQLDGNSALIEIPIIHCHVLTGDALEAAGFTYGNYRITVTVVLRQSGGTRINISRASNFVVYTNAKIIPEYLT